MQDLSLHILDLAENSLRAGARSICITVTEETEQDTLSVEIADDGCGMEAEEADRAADPFVTTRTTRRVGLGLSLMAQAAQESGGTFSVRSTPGRGTTVTALFRPSHIDCKPLGNMEETITTLVAWNPEVELTYCHCRNGATLRFATADVRTRVPDLPLD
ncbi:MAG: ATP-binding protein, partial [Bacteroidota bacterium]